MGFLRFEIIWVYCALFENFTQPEVCKLRDESVGFKPKNIKDSAPKGTLVHRFEFKSGDPGDIIYHDDISEHYFMSFVHQDAEDQPKYLTIRTSESFDDLLDLWRVEPMKYRPNISVSCAEEANVTLPDWFNMNILDTNNKAPRVKQSGRTLLNLENWEESKPFYSVFAYDDDYSKQFATISNCSAEWNYGPDQPELTVQISGDPFQDPIGYYKTKLDFYIKDKIITREPYSIRLRMVDLAGNEGISNLEIMSSSATFGATTLLIVFLYFVSVTFKL